MSRMIAILSLLLLLTAGCRKLLGPDPVAGNFSAPDVLENEADAMGYLANAYAHLRNNYWQYVALPLMVYADELQPANESKLYSSYVAGRVEPDNRINLNCWKSFFSLIYYANWWLASQHQAGSLSEEIRNQISGEFHFLRAFSYFHLIQLYGPVPLIKENNVSQNIRKGRTPVAEILKLITDDLSRSANLLRLVQSDGEAFRPNRFAVLLMQARVAMFAGDWNKSVDLTDLIIQSGNYELNAIPHVFQSGSSETIWQWWTASGIHDKAILILPTLNSTPGYLLSPRTEAIFDPHDLRKHHWIRSIAINGSFFSYPFKYQNSSKLPNSVAEYRVEMRLAEVYLIKAEALLRLERTGEAVACINKLRDRAGLAPVYADLRSDSAWHYWWLESQREFFTEGCHRFFSLKRFELAKEKLAPFKPAWKEGADLLPIPTQEIHLNPALTQNAGY